MKRYKHPNGFTYTEEELLEAAANENMTLEEFISNRGLKLITAEMDPISVDEGVVDVASVDSPIKTPSITHPTTEGFLNAASAVFTQEGDVVKFLNSHYDESQVRFVEAEAGRDSVEVLIGTQKEGEGEVFNLAWKEKNNELIFEEIKAYIDSQGDIKPRTIYNDGDVEEFDSKSFHTIEDGREVGVDKTQLIDDLREKFPKQQTGFTFETGEDSTYLKVTAPNGEVLEGNKVTELDIKNFINENSMNDDELQLIKDDELTVIRSLEENLLNFSVDYINENFAPIMGQISGTEKNPFNSVNKYYYDKKDNIQKAFLEEYNLKVGGGTHSLTDRQIDLVFDEAWNTLVQAEISTSIMRTSKALVTRLTTDPDAYKLYIDGLEKDFKNRNFKEGSLEAKTYLQFQELMKLNHDIATFIGSVESQEYKNLVNKSTALEKEYLSNFNKYIKGEGRVMFDVNGNRVNPEKISKEDKDSGLASGNIVDFGQDVDIHYNMLLNSYLVDSEGLPTNDWDKTRVAFDLHLEDYNFHNTLATKNNITLTFNLNNKNYKKKYPNANYLGGRPDMLVGSNQSAETSAGQRPFVGLEMYLVPRALRGGTIQQPMKLTWTDDDGNTYLLNDIVTTKQGRHKYWDANTKEFASIEKMFIVPKDASSEEWKTLVNKGVVIKTKDNRTDSDVWVFGYKDNFKVKGNSIATLGEMQLSGDDMLLMNLNVRYDFEDNESIETFNRNPESYLQKSDLFWGPGEVGVEGEKKGGGKWSLHIEGDAQTGYYFDDDPGTQYWDGEASPEFQFLMESLDAYRIDRKDMAVQSEAWKLLHMNVDPGFMERDKGDLYFKGVALMMPGNFQTAEAQIHNYSLDVDARIQTGGDLINEINGITQLLYPDRKDLHFGGLSKYQQDNLEMDWQEKFAYGMGSFTPMIAEFALLGAVTGGVSSYVGLTRLLGNMRKVVYVAKVGGKGFKAGQRMSKFQMMNAAKAAGMSVKAFKKAKGITKVAGGFASQAGAVLIGAILEEGKMQLMDPIFGVDMGDGTGFGFYLGGSAARWLTPFRFSKTGIDWKLMGNVYQTRIPSIGWKGVSSKVVGNYAPGIGNVFLERFALAGIGGLAGSEAASTLNASIMDAMGYRDFTTFLDEHYSGWEKWGGHAFVETLQFAVLGLTHMKRPDFIFGLKQKKKFRDNMIKKRDEYLIVTKGKRKIKDANGRKPHEEGYITTYKETKSIPDKGNAARGYHKYDELAALANTQINTIISAQAYTDINFLERKFNRDYNRFAKRFKRDPKNEGKTPFELTLTKDGYYRDAGGVKRKLTGGRVAKVDKNPETGEWDIITLDLRKVQPGTMPHEIYHVLMNKKFVKDLNLSKEQARIINDKLMQALSPILVEKFGVDIKFDKQGNLIGFEEREIVDSEGRMPGEKGYQKTVIPLDAFTKKVKKIYEEIRQDKSTFHEEYVTNLLELILNDKAGYEFFIKNNFAGMLKQDINATREWMFAGTRFEKQFAPKLSLDNPQSIIEFLARMGESWGKGGYNKRQVDRFVNLFKDHRVSNDGKIITKVVDIKPPKVSKEDLKSAASKGIDMSQASKGLKVEVVVNTKKEIIEEQKQILTELRQLVEDVKLKVIDVSTYNKRRDPLHERLSDITAQIRAGKTVKTKEEILQEQSDKVQAIYDNPKLSEQSKKNQIIKELDVFIDQIASPKSETNPKGKWRSARIEKEMGEQDYQQSDFKQDLIMEALTMIYPTIGARGQVRKAYDPSKGTPLTQYIMQNLPKRVQSIFKRANVEYQTKKVKVEKDVLEQKKEIESDYLETTSTVEGTGKYIKDVLIKTNKEGVSENLVKDSHLKDIINNFKELKGKKQIDLSPADVAGKDLIWLRDKVFGEVVYAKNKKGKEIKSRIDTNHLLERAKMHAELWRTIYEYGFSKGAMTKTGREFEGESSKIDQILMDGKYYKPTSRISYVESGKGAGLKVQEKIEGLTKEQYLGKMGIRIVDGKIDVSKITTHVRNPGDVNFKVMLAVEGEVLRSLYWQTIRSHVEKFKVETDPLLKTLDKNLKTLESIGELKPTKSTKNSIKNIERDINADLKKINEIREKYGLPEGFETAFKIDGFMRSIKSTKPEGLASLGVTLNQVRSIEKEIYKETKLTVMSLQQILEKENVDLNSPFATQLSRIIVESQLRKNIKTQLEEMKRESDIDFQLEEAGSFYRNAAEQIIKEFSKKYPELKNYDFKEVAREKSLKSYRRKKKNREIEKKYNAILTEKMSDLLNEVVGQEGGFNSMFFKSLGFSKRGGKVFVPDGKGGLDPVYSTSADGMKFIEANRNPNKKANPDAKFILENFNTITTSGKHGLKNKHAEFIKEKGPKGENIVDFDLKLAEYLMKLQSRDGTVEGYYKTVKANKMLRKLYLSRIAEIVNEAPKDKKFEAIVWMMRHLRLHTNFQYGILKGLAPLRYAGSTGTKFYAEHPLQLLNASFNFVRLQLGSKNKKEFNKGLDAINDLFNLASVKKSDQKKFDNKYIRGRALFMEHFKNKKIGELESIANIIYRPSQTFETIDLTLPKELRGQTIGERLVTKTAKKNILDILDYIKKKSPENLTKDIIQFEIDVINKENNVVKTENQGKILESQGFASKGLTSKQILQRLDKIDRAKELGRKKVKESKGMSTFDFDETLIVEGENFVLASKGKDIVKISSAKWPINGPKYAAKGYKFDFKDFVNVRGGVDGPLLQKMKNQINKFGPDNVFVLTARPNESAVAIHQWLKSKNIEIPLKNITGLGNSKSEAKAMWMVEKFAEGYNDMYFVDDALANVKAVRKVLDQLDIKSKVQLARSQEGMASVNISKKFNQILEESIGVDRKQKFSEASAKIQGKRKGWWKFAVGGPGMEDFGGLVSYSFSGRGIKGEQHQEFFKQTLEKPFNRAYLEINSLKQNMTTDYKELRKQMPGIKSDLSSKIKHFEGDMVWENLSASNKKTIGEFTLEQVVRIHLWNKSGYKIPGLSNKELKAVKDYMKNDAEAITFAENLSKISRIKKGYIKPSEYWLGENISIDLNNIVENVFRKNILSEFRENRESIFGKWENGRLVGPNINKIEAKFGSRHREALENMLWRMENGTNRVVGKDSVANRWMNWVNNATGTIMFFNQKSAAMQTISTINYMNGTFNNPIRAGKAFANQPQYWKDFAKIWNSDYLLQRRAGLKINVEAQELLTRVGGSKDKASAVLAYLLQKGFIPTKYADSFAISLGGATYYRNRIKYYEKRGIKGKEAEAKAWEDFIHITELTQQSSRPDLISMQQASAVGRPILAFANTPMQMFRRHKRRIQDIANNRGNMAENLGSALYYGFLQTMVFSFLTNAMFAVDDESDDLGDIKHAEKQKDRFVNTIADSYLRGMGTPGATVSALKNGIFSFARENEKGYRADYGNTVIELLNVSPPIGSKARKIYSSTKIWKYNKEVIPEMGFDLDNPANMMVANLISAFTNVPADRALKKTTNIRDGLYGDFENWERIALFSGWDSWSLNLETEANGKISEIKGEISKRKSIEKKKEKYGVETELEVLRIDKSKEIRKLNKNQQHYILRFLKQTSGQIMLLPKEEDRINKILEFWDKTPEPIDSLLNTNIDKDFDFYYGEVYR